MTVSSGVESLDDEEPPPPQASNKSANDKIKLMRRAEDIFMMVITGKRRTAIFDVEQRNDAPAHAAPLKAQEQAVGE